MFSRMGRASQDWVVANVVRSKTHLFGEHGDTLTRDPLVLTTRAVLHRYVATTPAGAAPAAPAPTPP